MEDDKVAQSKLDKYSTSHPTQTSGHRLKLDRRKISIFLALLLINLYYFLPRSLYPSPSNKPKSNQVKWQDDIWPIHNQTHWDISTSYPYTRQLTFTVNEGTWMRLDVNPVTKDIVFDLLGDIYCLSGSHWLPSSSSSNPINAQPILRGVPWDSDPQFNPKGDAIAFRSDAGLGVENIWIMPYTSCAEMALQTEEDIWRGSETEEQRTTRLHLEGRLQARRVTNETYRYLSEPRFHPSGSSILATKWYTSSRSLGAGEGWEYPIPSLSGPLEPNSIPVGFGQRLTERSLPFGWDESQYGDQQIGPEENTWWGDDGIIYAKNVVDEGTFQYSKDIHKGAYAIFGKNLTTGSTTTLVSESPGGASRPELSPDGRTLAFVRRNRDEEHLMFKDLETGTLHIIFTSLSYDLTLVTAPMGTYPLFSFTSSSDAVIIWAQGQIWSIPLSTNQRGERIASPSTKPRTIPFQVEISKKLAALRSGPQGGFDVLKEETGREADVRVITGLRVDESGEKVLFEAGGGTWVGDLSSSVTSTEDEEAYPSVRPRRLATSDLTKPCYSPSWVNSLPGWAIHAKWDNAVFTDGFELTHTMSKKVIKITGIPPGRYFNPILSPPLSNGKRVLGFVKTGGDVLTGDVRDTANVGFWTAEIEVDFSQSISQVGATNVLYRPIPINSGDSHLNIQFLSSPNLLLVQQSQSSYTIDLSSTPSEDGFLIALPSSQGISTTARMSSELSPQPIASPKWASFIDFKQVYVAPYSQDAYWSKPGEDASEGLARLSYDGGHEIGWSGDGEVLVWTLGPYIHTLRISSLLPKCREAIKNDPIKFGFECTTKLLDIYKMDMKRTTDIQRLKDEITGESDIVILRNATVLTMETGIEKHDLIRDAFVRIEGGVIRKVGVLGELSEEDMTGTVIDLDGAFVAPGFIDVHAHWSGFGDRYPSTSWEMETFLAYGVTTLHNPSSDNVQAFKEHDRVESGQLIGPRLYNVGNVLYGAAAADYATDVPDMLDAYHTLRRIKAEGGGSALSYKNYQIPVRGARQRLLIAAQDLGMLCFPEGGMNQDWDLTYIIDGMTTVEHALPVITWYDDIITLFALSGTGNTPTHVVNYGGPFGEQYIWATEDIPNNPKLRNFMRHDYLETLAESTSRPLNSWVVFNTSTSVAKMVKKGLKAHIGAHGEQPLGFNYHSEMFFTAAGGLSNYETLRAATSDAAKTLGLFPSLGSITPGKLADLVVYQPGINLLEEHISSTQKLRYVARGGRFWDADTMEEVWPVKGRKQVIPPINIEF